MGRDDRRGAAANEEEGRMNERAVECLNCGRTMPDTESACWEHVAEHMELQRIEQRLDYKAQPHAVEMRVSEAYSRYLREKLREMGIE